MQHASHATLLGYIIECVPQTVKVQEQTLARERWGALYLDMFYNGNAEQAEADNAFYMDGAALVARDFGRRGHLLLPRLPQMGASGTIEASRSTGVAGGLLAGTAEGSESELTNDFQRAAKERLQKDAWSLLWFSFLAMNTFPFTPAVITWLVRHAPWFPREWILPSQFEQRRLDGLRRARALSSVSAKSLSNEVTGGRTEEIL